MPNYLLCIACRGLKNDDGSSAKISVIRAEGDEEEIGKTDQLMGDTPVFDKAFDLASENDDDMLKVTILDENEQTRGVATFTVAKIKEHENRLGYLEMSANRGAVVVHLAEKSDEGTLKLKLKGKDLKNTEGYTGLLKSDPYFILSKSTGGDNWFRIQQSESQKDTLDPDWPEMELEIKELCQGDFDLPLKIQVFDKERFSKDEPMGSTIASVGDFMAARGFAKPFKLEEKGEFVGEILVEDAELDGCVDTKGAAKKVMESVAVALKARDEAKDKEAAIDSLKEEAAKAKEVAERAQQEADEKTKAAEEAEEGLAELVAAAEEAEAAIGGLA